MFEEVEVDHKTHQSVHVSGCNCFSTTSCGFSFPNPTNLLIYKSTYLIRNVLRRWTTFLDQMIEQLQVDFQHNDGRLDLILGLAGFCNPANQDLNKKNSIKLMDRGSVIYLTGWVTSSNVNVEQNTSVVYRINCSNGWLCGP